MRLHISSAVLCAVLVSGAAAGQEQRGSIQGTVKDSSGAVVPGVTVEARSAAGAVVLTTTDAAGEYRFPSVLPGVYEVSATLQSFRPEKVSDILVALGQVKRIDFALKPAGLSEEVTVLAVSPVIDIKQSTKATNIRAEQVELLPHNRDFTSLITMAPGANFEAKSTNDNLSPMIDGASAAENRYIIDGMETTSIFDGLSAKAVVADFVEEVQVKSSGYPAEYGGSTGGVINVITKSGTNRFSGMLLGYWQGSSVNGTCTRPGIAPLTSAGAISGSAVGQLPDGSPQPCGSNPTLRLTIANSNVAEYWTYPKDTVNRYEPGIALGGPLVKNKAWFFGAYQPALTRTTRTVNPATSGNPSASSISRTQKEEVQYLTANETMQLGEKLRTRVAFNNSWNQRDGQLPTLNGTDNPTTNYDKGSKYPNWSLSGIADYAAHSNLLLSLRAGYFRQDQHDYAVPDVTRYVFNSSNIGQSGVPVSQQHGSGFSNVPSVSAVQFNVLQRKFLQGDATWFGHAAGDHQIKGGVQIDLRGNDVNSGDLQQWVTLEWGSQYSATAPQGAFGYYHIRSNAVLPRQGFITQGNVSSNVYGGFVQDNWTVNNKLTLNLGVRTEKEKVPAYTSSNNVYGSYPIQFGFGDKVAPRAGFAYDIQGDGRWKAFGSWGMFYDIFKLDLGQESFGGAKWIEWYFTLDNPNFETLNSNSNCPPTCSGTFITKVDERLPSLAPGQVSTDLKPMRSQEAAFGLEHQVGPVMGVGVRYIHKQLDRGIEDTGAIDPETDDEPYIIANPGEAGVKTFNVVTNCFSTPTCSVYAGSSGKYTLPKPKRQYDAVELWFDKRLSNNWSFHGSYTLSRDYGNYPGLGESDEVNATTGRGRVSPNIGRLFDYPIEQFDGHGKPLYGALPTDRTHMVKGQFIYQWPFGTAVGVTSFVGSGIPISRSISVIPGHGYLLYYNGRGSEGRTPVLSRTDLYVQHEFRLPRGKRFQINATVLNVFDRRTVLDRFQGIRRAGSTLTFDENAFYAGQVDIQSAIDRLAFPTGGMRVDPRFMQNLQFLAPLQARFGFKVLF